MKILSLFALIFATNSHAAVFDAADFLSPHSATLGAFGEILLSDPSSEGVEARGRYGLSEEWNVGAIFGVGSKNKQTRIGGEAVYSFIPDYDGQVGLSAILGAQYQKRNGAGGLYMRLAPLAHKKVTAWNGMPATIYLSLPFYIDARGGNYSTGTHLVLGAIMDVNSHGRFYAVSEAGVRISKAESYILLGAGVRFGEVRLARGEKKKSKNKDEESEYRDEDFTTPIK